MIAGTADAISLWLGSPRSRLQQMLGDGSFSCNVVLPDGETLSFGAQPQKLKLVFRDWSTLRRIIDEFSFARAYVEGRFDIEGDIAHLFDARRILPDKARLMGALTLIRDLFLSTSGAVNKRAIAFHYSFGDDFYHRFIDRTHHFYSHGIFEREDESIEQASTHKLEQMFEALELKPGMHLLDIGGGWGPVTRYCCPRGLKVTTLTIAEDSFAFLTRTIAENGYDARVIRQDFLEHAPEQPYDAIVIYGVIEHIPRYRRFAANVWNCLKPGGRLYLDGSAAYRKYDTSTFTKRYIWPGTHSFMCVQDVIQELLYHGLDVLRLKDETRDYELTMLEWARRFEAAGEEIVRHWGETTYRAFRLYLWGGMHALRTRELQAYHLVARRRDDPGPRPGLLARGKDFAVGWR